MSRKKPSTNREQADSELPVLHSAAYMFTGLRSARATKALHPHGGMQSVFRTANSAVLLAPEELVFDCAATANALPEQLADGWHVLAPFGEFPEPGGRYVQVFGAPQADAMIRSWNSIGGKAFRWMKNVRHRLGAKLSMPIFDAPPGAAHPDLDPTDWSKLPLVGEVTDLRATANALEGKVVWSDAARRGDRERGPLHPSINWWHNQPDAQGRVYPEHVESVTLTRTPNIRTVPAWTANTLPGTSPEENQTANTNTMNEQQLRELRLALGLPETADAAAILTTARTANAAATQLAERDSALNTANTTVTTLNAERDTLRTQHVTLTAERDTLRTANTVLTTERDTLIAGLLAAVEKRGIITPAESGDFKTRLTTANTAAAALTELATRKPAMNTQAVEINGTRLDLSTANSRQTALQDAVAKRMKADDCDYDTAYARVKADPNFSALFAAMQDPAKAKA